MIKKDVLGIPIKIELQVCYYIDPETNEVVYDEDCMHEDYETAINDLPQIKVVPKKHPRMGVSRKGGKRR